MCPFVRVAVGRPSEAALFTSNLLLVISCDYVTVNSVKPAAVVRALVLWFDMKSTLVAPEWNPLSLGVLSRASSIEEIVTQLRDVIGIEHIVYHSSHFGASPSLDPYIRLTYPAAWIKRYLQMDYVKIDPVLRNGFQRALPFFWSELEASTSEEVQMLLDAMSHGVGPFGFSIPVRSKRGHRGLFSLSSSEFGEDWTRFCSENLVALVEIANALHQRVIAQEFGDAKVSLSSREIECLQWTALGKEAKDIAIILGISLHTTRDYLKSARFKLNCLNLAQAVNKANHLGFLP